MRAKILSLVVVIIGCMTSCANKSVFTSYSSLKGYNYVLIDESKDVGGGASLMNFKVQLQQAIKETRMEEVGLEDVKGFRKEQLEQLVVLQLSGSQTELNSVATINICDYKTKEVLGSCNGIFGAAFSTYGDMNGAIKKACRAFKRMTLK